MYTTLFFIILALICLGLVGGPGCTQQSTHIWQILVRSITVMATKCSYCSSLPLQHCFLRPHKRSDQDRMGNLRSPGRRRELILGVEVSERLKWQSSAAASRSHSIVTYLGYWWIEVCLSSQASFPLILLFIFHSFSFSPIPHHNWPRIF